MRTSLILFTAIVLFSCEKYDHMNIVIPDCELCDYAASVEGSYRGFRDALYPELEDSLTVLVQQVYLENSQIEDSTIMFLETTTIFDNITWGPIIDTVRVDNSQGYNMDHVQGNSEEFYFIRDDSLEIRRDQQTSQSSYICLTCGILYKQ